MDGVGAALLAEARALGLEVRADGGRLVVRGPRSRAALAQRVLARKQDVLERLATEVADVAWRAEAMRAQVPERGPLPFLAARDVVPTPGLCRSCGDPMSEDRVARCAPCAQAAWLALHEVWEGLDPPRVRLPGPG